MLLHRVDLDVLVAIRLYLGSVALGTRSGSASLSGVRGPRGILIDDIETNVFVLRASVPCLNGGFVVHTGTDPSPKSLTYYHRCGTRCGGLSRHLESKVGIFITRDIELPKCEQKDTKKNLVSIALIRILTLVTLSSDIHARKMSLCSYIHIL